MSKLNICNTGTAGRSVLNTEVVPLYKEIINQIKSKIIGPQNITCCCHTTRAPTICRCGLDINILKLG